MSKSNTQVRHANPAKSRVSNFPAELQFIPRFWCPSLEENQNSNDTSRHPFGRNTSQPCMLLTMRRTIQFRVLPSRMRS
jgi:hypothetical protein